MIASLTGLAKSYPIAACARCSEPWRSDLFGCPKLPLIDIGPFFRIDAAFKSGLICGEYRRILISDAKPRRDVGAKRSRSGRAAGGQLLRPAHPSFQSDKFIHCAVGYDLYRLPSSPVFVADLLSFGCRVCLRFCDNHEIRRVRIMTVQVLLQRLTSHH